MRLPPLPSPSAPLTAEQVAARTVGDPLPPPTAPVTVVDYDPAWPVRYAREEARIRAALGARALAVDHVGSTAVPGLAAKNRLDIDLIVADPADEAGYVPALEAAGYTLRTREPHWYEHRCLWTPDHGVNLHVFGPDCDEYLRHLIFRDWLRAHPADRDRYAAEKRRIAALRPTITEYVALKSAFVLDVLRRAGLGPAMGDLVTTRLVLHPLTAGESERVLAGEPDGGARWAPGYPTAGDVMAARRFLGACADTGDPQPFGNYEIRRREDGQAIGGLGFHGPADESGSVTIGFGLIPSARGQGYAAEALRGLLLFARGRGVTCVKGDTDHDNIASQRVMAAAGLRPAGADERLRYFEITWTDPDT